MSCHSPREDRLLAAAHAVLQPSSSPSSAELLNGLKESHFTAGREAIQSPVIWKQLENELTKDFAHLESFLEALSVRRF
jgi:hypothetical protein